MDSKAINTNQTKKVAQMVSQAEIFQSVSYAAVRARVNRLEQGEIIKIGWYEFVIDEDDADVNVQIIKPRDEIEDLAAAKAFELGVDLKSMTGGQKSQWIGEFFNELQGILQKWHQIKIGRGPGGDLSFEKTAYRKDMGKWR